MGIDSAKGFKSMRYCPQRIDLIASSGVYDRAKNTNAKKLVTKVFKMLGAEKSGVIKSANLVVIDKKDKNAAHGNDMGNETLSRVDFQMALHPNETIDLDKVSNKPIISQYKFMELLGACYTQGGLGNDVVVTKDMALLYLSNNKDAVDKLQSVLK